MDSFLQDQHSVGESHSQGGFTISLRESVRKLREYQFKQPEIYVLLLVSATIAKGATKVEVREDSRSLVLSFQGCFYSFAELERFRETLSSDLHARDQGLTLGLVGALESAAGRVTLISSTDQGRVRWTVEADGGRLVEDKADAAPLGTRIEIPKHTLLRGLFRRLKGFAGLTAESRLLYNRCERALVPVKIQGESVNRPLILGEVAALAVIGPVSVEALVEQRYHLPQKGWCGAVSLGARPLLGGASGLTAVVHGVSYPLPKLSCLQGLVWHDGLRTDLSQSGILEDPTCSELLQELQLIQDELAHRLVKEVGSLNFVEVCRLQELVGPPVTSGSTRPALMALFNALATRRMDLEPPPPDIFASAQVNSHVRRPSWTRTSYLPARLMLLKSLEALETNQAGIALLNFSKLEHLSTTLPSYKAAAVVGDAICREVLTDRPHLSRGLAKAEALGWSALSHLRRVRSSNGLGEVRAAFLQACQPLLKGDPGISLAEGQPPVWEKP